MKSETARQLPCTCACDPVQIIYISIIVLAEVQGSFTFPPQQMPHASDFIRITDLGCWGENSRLQDARLSRSGKDVRISEEDGVIGIK
jgi:hypothetical protein